MKAVALIAVLSVLVCTQIVLAQGTSMYDTNYRGPMNVYGQPVLTVPQTQRSADGNQQQQVPLNGPIPQAVRGAQALGGYFWSYMPASFTGATSPYAVPPGSGSVTVNFVPGAP